MGLKCPKCHSDNPSDSKFCKDCGSQLLPKEKTPVSKTITIRTPVKDVNIGEIIAEKYKLIEELGKGGMGIVYKAEQIKPVKRGVALKVIKLGMDTGQVVARFETERQALAVMNHPNIAKVFDAGATERGRPYFVMELVQGVPITEYCDKHKLRTRERLELFMAVCEAVQHAHQKGVIHRDLKPSNVIVSVQENKPVPKIIDFGIAKATGHRLTERTLFTEQGQLIGTPEYMSPEQAEMSGLDIDTRTDIYSLGVMLYELLVGVLPFEPKTIREAGFSEIQRMIRETDPPKASTRLSKLGDTQTSIAEHRRTDPVSLQRQLKGDLDWITMKAMSKDRTQRYASASELASDIMRHLKHDPILASPPSTIYRIRKYVRRHKTGVVAAALVVLAMVIGITGTSIGLVKARLAEKKAKTEAETARQVSDFLVDLFKVSDPSEAKGNTITAREILDEGANKIATSLQDQPPVQARMMNTIGKVYMNLGLYKQSAPLLENALELRRKVYGENYIEVAESLYNLSLLYTEEAKYDEAESLGKRSFDIREKALGPEHPDTAESLSNLGEIYRKMGKFDEAESFFRRSLDVREKALGPEHTDVASSLNSVANVAQQQGKYDLAEPLYKRALKIWEKVLGQDNLKVANCLNNLALLYWKQDKFEEAEPLYKRCLSIKEKVYGPEHPDVALSLHNLGLLYSTQGRFTEAESLYRRSIRIEEETRGPDHPDVALKLDSLAILFCRHDKFEESIPFFQRSLEIREKALGPDHPDVAFSLNNLAATYGNLKMHDKIESLFKRALSIREKAYGPDHPLVAASLQNLGHTYFDMGKFEEAEPLIQRSLSIREKTLGPEHSSIASSLHILATLYRDWKKYDKAEPIYQKALSIAEKVLPPNHWQLAEILDDYAIFLRKVNRPEEAKKLEARVKAIRSK
jgi:serine/threonine protein kinase/tetratricopeptide (TPR) repeat protein